MEFKNHLLVKWVETLCDELLNEKGKILNSTMLWPNKAHTMVSYVRDQRKTCGQFRKALLLL